MEQKSAGPAVVSSMCRGKQNCSELGTNPENWSKVAPLLPPLWFKEELSLFSSAVHEAAVGNIEKSLKSLLKIRSNELREWFVEHGQVSGRFRTRILKIQSSVTNNPELDPLRSPDRFAKEVFSRDGYHCRYCGIGVIPKEILASYGKAVGVNSFCATGTNQARHGVILAFRANADHVYPWNSGGKTNLDNLVTSCWSCNYGKAGYTLEELGLTDPRENEIISNDWDGLLSLKRGLKQNSA